MDMCHQQSKIKESILFSIWMDLPESGELRGRRKCCWHVRYKEAWYRFGEAVGAECEEAQVDVWLAPQ